MLLNVDCGGFTRKMTKEEYDLIFNKQNIKSEKIKKPVAEEPKIEESKIEEVLEPVAEEPKIEEVLEPVVEEKIKSKKK